MKIDKVIESLAILAKNGPNDSAKFSTAFALISILKRENNQWDGRADVWVEEKTHKLEFGFLELCGFGDELSETHAREFLASVLHDLKHMLSGDGKRFDPKRPS